MGRGLPLALVVGCAFACTLCHAHDYWLERGPDGLTLYQGHAYSPHEGERHIPYDPRSVKHAACLDRNGGLAMLPLIASYPVRFSGRCPALLVQMAPSYWSQTLSESVAKPKSEVRGALRGWLSEESVKRIDGWTAQISRPLLDGLELVPLEDPFALRPGDKLRLLVTWRSQPLRGAVVAYNGNARGVSGRNGEVSVRLRHGGMQILSASFEQPITDPNADKVVRTSILHFELPR